MSKTKPRKGISNQIKPQPIVGSLLDHMIDDREFESLLKFTNVKIDLAIEVRKSLDEIRAIRNRPAICYLANVVSTKIKSSTAIDPNDDLPFSEMIAAIPASQKSIDVILVTPGGSGQQVAKFVDKLRPRFDDVSFILPYMAMSAGTIFAMSGNDIIMGKNSYIGPTDPQVMNREGQWIPAQSILTLIEDIKARGEELISNGKNPPWTDLQILNRLDGKEIGNAINMSRYSMELVQGYLSKYKFANWTEHSSTKRLVTDEEKRIRAEEISKKLCNHGEWKTHSRGIPRDVAWSECKIKITHTESIEGLDRAVRRLWALLYWAFENANIYKAFISDKYCIFRTDRDLIK